MIKHKILFVVFLILTIFFGIITIDAITELAIPFLGNISLLGSSNELDFALGVFIVPLTITFCLVFTGIPFLLTIVFGLLSRTFFKKIQKK